MLTSTYNGTTTTYAYDAFNRLVTITDADGRITQYVYDDNSNVQRQIDGEGNITSYFYDELVRQFLSEKGTPSAPRSLGKGKGM